MTIKAPINPAYGNGQLVAATTTAATITLGASTKQVMFLNLGPQSAYVRMTPGAVVDASQVDAILPVNIPVVYTKFEDIRAISLVSTSTSSIHVMPCEGLAGF
jgi:hypothetical protein